MVTIQAHIFVEDIDKVTDVMLLNLWIITISLEASSWIGPQGPQGGVEETEDTLPPVRHPGL